MGKVCFQSSYFQQQNGSLVCFFKKGFHFCRKLASKLKHSKHSKDCHIKKCQCKTCQKSVVSFFRTYAVSVGFQKKPLKK